MDRITDKIKSVAPTVWQVFDNYLLECDNVPSGKNMTFYYVRHGFEDAPFKMQLGYFLTFLEKQNMLLTIKENKETKQFISNVSNPELHLATFFHPSEQMEAYKQAVLFAFEQIEIKMKKV